MWHGWKKACVQEEKDMEKMNARIMLHPMKRQHEFFPGFPIDDGTLDGRDMCRALDEVEKRNGIVRPERPDPSVLQDPPSSVTRYPTPELMKNIRAQRLQLIGASACPPDPMQDIRPMIGNSIWPDDRRNSFDAIVHAPLSIRGQPILGLDWGREEIDSKTRQKGIMAEMARVGREVFRIQDMIPSQLNTNSGQALKAMMARIDTAIAMRKPDPMSFKIGITWNPPHRWANTRYGYSHDGYKHMDILTWDCDARIIGLYETSLISNYQRDAKCLNE